jgi:bifunctional ADP-heptose synthase (sugar kinase/adenylyltransferase)
MLRRNGRRVVVVSGYFDPLLAEHAERLEEIRRGSDALLVLVRQPPQPILPPRARAELVAGLSAVDYVVAPEDGETLDETALAAMIHEEDADVRRLAALARLVHRRQGAGERP